MAQAEFYSPIHFCFKVSIKAGKWFFSLQLEIHAYSCWRQLLQNSNSKRTQVVAIPRQCPKIAWRCRLQVVSGRVITADRVQTGFYQKRRFCLQHGQKISHQPLLLLDRTQVTVAKESASKYFPRQNVTEAVCNCTKLGRLGKSQSETMFWTERVRGP